MARLIQVLGTGCPKCKLLAANAEEAVRSVGADARVEKVEKIQDILKFGVMMTPALAIDGKVVSSGKVLGAEEIGRLMSKER
jgi:small redox-active disulfide protein 2